MESPMQLIMNSADGKLSVAKDAVDMLKKMNQPLVVVALVGKYRTGKSFLLNRLAGRKTGFPVGGSVQSETKGIWMWCLPHPCGDNRCMVLLDTEGLGDVEKGDESNDSKLFALAILLSSMFVYNSKGTIDQQALQDINYVTELTRFIRAKSGKVNDNGEDFMEYFPDFVWVVRDFTLQLNIDGKSATANQYLENALKLKHGDSEKITKFNVPKQCIRGYFRSRNCFVFDPPGNKYVLQNIETVDECKLDQYFVQSCQEFCDFIYREAETKTVPNCGNKMVTGPMFAHLLNTYVDIISSGKLACLDKVVQSLVEVENEKAVNEATKRYEEQMKQLVTFPTETAQELNKIHEKCHQEAFDIFLKRGLGEREKHRKKLEENIKRIIEGYTQRNEMESEKKCKELLKELFGKIDNKIMSSSYGKAGGYIEYLADRKDAEDSYNSKPQKGVKAKKVFKQFLSQRMTDSELIRQKDQSLTEQDRRMEAEKEKQDMMEQQKILMEQQMKMVKETVEAMARSNENTMNQFMKMMAEERAQQREEREKYERKKQEEMERMRTEKGGCVIQ